MHSTKLSYVPLDKSHKRKPFNTFDHADNGLHLVQQTPQGQQPIISTMEHASKGLLTSIHNYNREAEAPTMTMRVLQVEDNSENRFIVHRYLRNDYDYDSVNQGEHALDILDNENFDIIIMDINLGSGIDGIETARQIRSQRKYDHIAIIAVTANVSPEIKGECMKAGMDGFLPKPFRKQELKETMQAVLKDRNRR